MSICLSVKWKFPKIIGQLRCQRRAYFQPNWHHMATLMYSEALKHIVCTVSCWKTSFTKMDINKRCLEYSRSFLLPTWAVWKIFFFSLWYTYVWLWWMISSISYAVILQFVPLIFHLLFQNYAFDVNWIITMSEEVAQPQWSHVLIYYKETKRT